jgi:hypothetical protein
MAEGLAPWLSGESGGRGGGSGGEAARGTESATKALPTAGQDLLGEAAKGHKTWRSVGEVGEGAPQQAGLAESCESDAARAAVAKLSGAHSDVSSPNGGLSNGEV